MRKLIKDVSMTIQTTSFDEFIASLQTEIDQQSGFVQSSTITGNSYTSTSYRHATIVTRIPAGNLDQFTGQVSALGKVTSKTENVKDVTMSYVDVESHIKALQTEQESLLKLMESATKLDDIIKIQDRLTNVRTDLESYETKLRTYNDLISYSTVTMNISEVTRVTDTESKGFWQQIGSKFINNLYHIGRGFRGFFIWFIGNSPILLLIAAAVLIVIACIRFHKKRKRRRQAEMMAYNEENHPENRL